MRQVRVQWGWTIKQLARLCDTTEAAISRYETGNRVPYPAMRERIARELHVEPEYLWPAAHAKGKEAVA